MRLNNIELHKGSHPGIGHLPSPLTGFVSAVLTALLGGCISSVCPHCYDMRIPMVPHTVFVNTENGPYVISMSQFPQLSPVEHGPTLREAIDWICLALPLIIY